MKIDPVRCTLVIAGSWNVAIFGPEFASQHIFGGLEEIQPEMVFGAEGLLPLYRGPHFDLMVHPNKLLWRPQSVGDESLQPLEDAAVSLLGILSVTPITAVGVNFGFDVDEPEGLLRDLLALPDTAEFEGTSGTRLRSTTIRRTISLDDDILNLGIARDPGDIVKIDLNFHKVAASAADAKQRLAGSILPSRERALRLLRDWYGLSMEGA